jgi:hypothetical protein
MPRVISYAVAIVLLPVLTAGCDQVLNALRNMEARTITLDPVKVAVRQDVTWANFGICHSHLESRVVGSRLGGVFDRRTDRSLAGLSGYEVGVARGESCHLRETSQFQTAVQFDLRALPAGEVTRAELRMRSVADYGLDPPIRQGTTAQCNVLVVGLATADWEPAPERTFDLVPWTVMTPRLEGFGWGARSGRSW